jgi:peptide/nickel transport system ATP-binding protein
MYAGEVVESAPAAELFAEPKHPYTQGLLRCVPVPGKVRRDEELGAIRGTVPRVGPDFEGCAFRERCDFANQTCEHTISRRHASGTHDYLCRLA